MCRNVKALLSNPGNFNVVSTLITTMPRNITELSLEFVQVVESKKLQQRMSYLKITIVLFICKSPC